MHPLAPLPSIKLKIGTIILAAVGVTIVVFWAATKLGLWPSVSGVLAGICALVITRYLARGLTLPLREMSEATTAMARGDYERRVNLNSKDEVGQLAASFNQMAAELDATERMRRDLIANVSHELRTPITALQAVLENLVDGVVEPDTETIRLALTQTERLGELVTNLLDLSRLEGGAIALQHSQFHVGDFLRDAVEHVALTPASVDVVVAASPTDLVAVADPARLRQVVVNLVDNAIRHSPPGGRVSVLARAADPSGLRLEVCDGGPGIPPSEREQVFERFTRGATSAGGTGLGLAIARWAVELHGGSIEVMPTAKGCRIAVTIPNPPKTEEIS
jgi:signal transduction histidine kinase